MIEEIYAQGIRALGLKGVEGLKGSVDADRMWAMKGIGAK